MLEYGVWSSQPLELPEPSQAKTTKRGVLMTRAHEKYRIIWMLVLSLLLGVVTIVVSWTSDEFLSPEKKAMLSALVLVVMALLMLIHMIKNMNCNWTAPVLMGVAKLARMLPLWWQEVLVLLQNLKRRVVDFHHALLHRRRRLMKWGPDKWVLDSGAWVHCTSNLLVLQDLRFQEVANPRVWLGSVRTERFQFPSVCYIARDDDDARNVVSVSQLARDHGLVTVFEPTSCHVKDKKTGKILGKGRLHNGMYMLDYLRIRQYIGDDGEASTGGEHGVGGGGGRGHGGRGNNGEGDSGTAEGRGGGSGGGASINHEKGGNANGATGGDINNEHGEGNSKNETQGTDDDNVEEDDNGEIHQERNGNGEEENKERQGGGRSNFGKSSKKKARTGLLRLLQLGFVLFLCIAASISFLQYIGWGTGVTVLPMDLHRLLGFWFLVILILLLIGLRMSMMQSTRCKIVKQIGALFRGRSTDDGDDKEEGTPGDHYVQESPHQEHNRQLFGLSRFDVTTDGPTGRRRRYLPAGAFPTSTNASRREEFLVDSGASFHATWKESVLFPYPQHLQDHTKPPTRRFGGIVGSIVVTRSGYLNGDRIMLDGVLLAPESRMNLVSVGQLSIQYGVQVEMDDKEVIIKNKWDGVQVGGGKMLNNHQYVLEHFQPAGGLFAHLHTPHPKIFGRRRPGPV